MSDYPGGMSLRTSLTAIAAHEQTEQAAAELQRAEAREQHDRATAAGDVAAILRDALGVHEDLAIDADHHDVDEVLVTVDDVMFMCNTGRQRSVRLARLCPHCGTIVVYPHAILRARDIVDPLAADIAPHDITGAPTPQRCDGQDITPVVEPPAPAPYKLRHVAAEDGGDRVMAELAAAGYWPEMLTADIEGEPIVLFRHVTP